MLTEALLSAVAEAVFGYLLQEADLADRVRAVLGIDPQRRAFQTALARAYNAFAQQYPDLAASLFDETFLKTGAAPVLAQLLTRRGQPDPADLVRRWATHLGHPNPDGWPRLAEATHAAADFLRRLEAELAEQQALWPLWDARALEKIKDSSDAIRQMLEKDFRNALEQSRQIQVTGNVEHGVIIAGDHNTMQEGQNLITIRGTVYNLVVGNQIAPPPGTPPVSIPRPFMTPPLPPQGIFGRDDDLARIFDLLALDDAQTIDVPPVALVGMGGVGKTTLAVALGRLEIIPKLFPDGVLWAAPGPNPTIRFLLDSWGRALGVDLLPERDENACRDRLRAVLHHRRVLLIVDDVWEVPHGQYFTVAGPRCRTLITTRESPVAHALATRERTLRVDVLKPDAALALLRRLAPEAVLADEQNAIRLCERLEFLPLALTLAGRLLASEADVPTRMQRVLKELIERRESRLQLLQAEGRLGLTENQPVSLQAILGMSVERLSKTDQERFAMLAVFGGEPLTWEINAAAYVWECSVEEAEAAISRFIQRGLVERRGNRYWMHALLADYAAEMMESMGL